MKEQLLRDPDTEPTNEIISEELGDTYGVYAKLIKELAIRGVQVNWRYYHDSKAWLGKALYRWTTARGTQKEKTAFWLSIWDGFFKVSLYLPEKARADALALPLGRAVLKMIGDSHPMGKSKLIPLIFELNSDELFNDLYTLIHFRVTLK